MNWIISIGAAFLLGWIVGEIRGKVKGYALATSQIKQQMIKEAMLQQFKRVMEEDDGNNEKR